MSKNTLDSIHVLVTSVAKAATVVALVACGSPLQHAPAITQPVRSQQLANLTSALSSPDSATFAVDHSELENEAEHLKREIDALRNDPKYALSVCDEDAITLPNSLLAEERETIAIEALARLGRMDEAKAREKNFEAKFPESSYLNFVRWCIGDGSVRPF